MSDQILDDDIQPYTDDEQIVFATFWDRVGASLIDGLIFVPLVGLTVLNQLYLKIFGLEFLLALAFPAYKIFMEWEYGATIGKRYMKLVVVNEENGRISLEQSMLRFSLYAINTMMNIIISFTVFQSVAFREADTFMEISLSRSYTGFETLSTLTSLIVMVSVLFVAFDAQKQALHDKIAKTYVLRKANQQNSGMV